MNKTYKLLKEIHKDMPVKVGETYDTTELFVYITSTGYQFENERLISHGYIEELKDIRHPGRHWKPGVYGGKPYFYISPVDVITSTHSTNGYLNTFKTIQLAQKELDKRKAIVKIMEYISDTYGIFEPDWSDEHERKYYIFYSNLYNLPKCTFAHLNKFYSPIGCFSEADHAQDIIQKFDKELRLIYDINL